MDDVRRFAPIAKGPGAALFDTIQAFVDGLLTVFGVLSFKRGRR